jgi:hypothetical protein
MFEASRSLPDLWITASHRIDYIVVPTLHNYRLWNENLLFPMNKVHQISFGVDAEKVAQAGTFDVIDMDSDLLIKNEFKYL